MCIEVAEHLPPEDAHQMLTNLNRVTNNILILSWSNESNETNRLHLNPKPREEVLELMRQYGRII